MAIEHMMGQDPWTLPASTGIAAFRFVTMSGGNAALATSGTASVIGVTTIGTTGSTSDSSVGIYPLGSVAKVTAPASTVAKGDKVSCSTAGQVAALGAGDFEVGIVVAGSSGGAGRVLSVLLTNAGTT